MRARLKALHKEYCVPKRTCHFDVINFTSLRPGDIYFDYLVEIYGLPAVKKMFQQYGESEHLITLNEYPEHDLHLLFLT